MLQGSASKGLKASPSLVGANSSLAKDTIGPLATRRHASGRRCQLNTHALSLQELCLLGGVRTLLRCGRLRRRIFWWRVSRIIDTLPVVVRPLPKR